MNCKSVQEWLPLYVGRDLEDNRNQVITAHLQSCAECAGLATEYHETRQFLGDFTPAFGDDVYSSIRQNVLRDIEREAPDANPGPLAQLFLDVFRPPLVRAAVSVFLLTVGMFAFYFIAHRGNINQPVAGFKPEASPRPPTLTPPSSPVETATIKPHRTQVRKRFGLADRGATAAVNKRGQPSIRSEAALDSNNLAGPTAVQSSGKFIRLEMQTKDPNIRIIWLTPQRTKARISS